MLLSVLFVFEGKLCRDLLNLTKGKSFCIGISIISKLYWCHLTQCNAEIIDLCSDC